MNLRPCFVRAVAALGAAVLAGACSPAPECDPSACGEGSGSVTSVRGDGSRAWTAPVHDTGATLLVGDGTVVVDGCRAVTVLDAATGRVLLETDDVKDAGAVAGGLLVGSARTDDQPRLLGIRLDGRRGGFSWSSTSGSTMLAPSTVVPTGSGFAVAFGDSLHVVVDPSRSADLRTPVRLPSQVAGAPVALAGGVVLAATADGSVYGIRDGALRWRVVPQLVGARVDTGITPVSGGALVSSSSSADRSETAFTTAEGEVRWRAPGTVPHASVLGAGSDVVLLSTPTGTHVHDLRTGVRLWNGPRLDPDSTLLVTSAGVATTEVRPGGAGRVVLRAPRRGSVLWDREGVLAGPAGATGVLVHDPTPRPVSGRVSAVDAATGDVLWATAVTTTHPASTLGRASAAGAVTTLVVDVPPRPMVMCE